MSDRAAANSELITRRIGFKTYEINFSLRYNTIQYNTIKYLFIIN